MRLMQKHIRKALLGLFVGAIAFGLSPSMALAQSSEQSRHIVMTPATSEISVAPGETTKGHLTVVNQGGDAFGVELSVHPYNVSGADYNPIFKLSDDKTIDPAKWVSLSSRGADRIEPTKLLDVNYSISVPSGIAPGGYYVVIFAETIPVDNSQSAGVSSRNRVGQIVYITVEGDAKQFGSVKMPNVPAFHIGTDYQIQYLVKNEGDVHFVSKTKVEISDMFGKKVFSQHQDRYILPKTERQIEFDIKKLSPINFYTIKRSATLPNGKTQSDTSKMLVVSPIALTVMVIGLIVIIGLAVVKSKKRR